METPRDEAGHMTEHIMAEAQMRIEHRKIDPLTTAQYNSIYGSVYDILSKRFKP